MADSKRDCPRCLGYRANIHKFGCKILAAERRKVAKGTDTVFVIEVRNATSAGSKEWRVTNHAVSEELAKLLVREVIETCNRAAYDVRYRKFVAASVLGSALDKETELRKIFNELRGLVNNAIATSEADGARGGTSRKRRPVSGRNKSKSSAGAAKKLR